MAQNLTATLKYLKIAPRKTRLLASVVRGLPVDEAEAQLLFSSRRAHEPLLKLLRSAIANAKHNYHLDKNTLYIKEIRVDEGPRQVCRSHETARFSRSTRQPRPRPSQSRGVNRSAVSPARPARLENGRSNGRQERDG